MHQHSHGDTGWYSHAEKALAQPCTGTMLSSVPPAESQEALYCGGLTVTAPRCTLRYRLRYFTYKIHIFLAHFCWQTQLRY